MLKSTSDQKDLMTSVSVATAVGSANCSAFETGVSVTSSEVIVCVSKISYKHHILDESV